MVVAIVSCILAVYIFIYDSSGFKVQRLVGDPRTAALFRIRESRKKEWRKPAWNIRKEVRNA